MTRYMRYLLALPFLGLAYMFGYLALISGGIADWIVGENTDVPFQ